MALRRKDFDEEEQSGKKTTKRPRITIDVSPELRRRIKIAASQSDQSISEYIAKILDEAVPREVSTIEQQGHPVTREAIERLRQLRKKILAEHKGELFEDSTELIRQMREERSRELEQL